MARPNFDPTTFRITAANMVSLDIDGYATGEMTAEASTLGLPVGEFPETIVTDLGNKMPFVKRETEVINGDLQSVLYIQANGILELRIFND